MADDIFSNIGIHYYIVGEEDRKLLLDQIQKDFHILLKMDRQHRPYFSTTNFRFDISGGLWGSNPPLANIKYLVNYFNDDIASKNIKKYILMGYIFVNCEYADILTHIKFFYSRLPIWFEGSKTEKLCRKIHKSCQIEARIMKLLNKCDECGEYCECYRRYEDKYKKNAPISNISKKRNFS